MSFTVKKELIQAIAHLIGEKIPCGNQAAVSILEALKNPDFCAPVQEPADPKDNGSKTGKNKIKNENT